jgi:lysozyme
MLAFGSTGHAVVRLQQRLQELGYHVNLDGRFGSQTEDAVQQFQASSGLPPDGIVGPATLGALNVRPIVPTPTPVHPTYTVPNAMVVDIYHGDTVHSFAQAHAAGTVGIIHKATQGSEYQDSSYDTRRALAESEGMLWGAYHFGTNDSVPNQVTNFLSMAQPGNNTLVALDYEPNGRHTMSLAQAKAFMQMVADVLGRRPVLYSGNLIKETISSEDEAFFGQHRLWLAQYGSHPTVPSAWDTWWLWQHTGDGVGPDPKTVPGIPGAGGLDVNSFAGSVEDLTKEWAS